VRCVVDGSVGGASLEESLEIKRQVTCIRDNPENSRINKTSFPFKVFAKGEYGQLNKSC
jgi:hypothetical protein